jgi:hypothetical protein
MEEKIGKRKMVLLPDTITMVPNKLNYKTRERRRSNGSNYTTKKTVNKTRSTN